MYTLLVVDDFALDRQQMAQTVATFTDLPLKLVGECEDGIEALEIIRDLKPDILLCDVEMPHINGLELADRLRRDKSDIRIIFCSLYDKLHYLKAAISVRSDGYIMKPFTAAELHDCIAGVLMDLINLDEQKHELDTLRKAMENSRDMMETHFLSDLIFGYVTGQDELAARCQTLNFPLEAPFRIAAAEIDDYYTALYDGSGKGENSLVCYRVFRMLEDGSRREDGKRVYRVVRMTEKCYALVFGLEEGESEKESGQATEQTLNALIRKAHAATVSLTATFGEQTRGLLKMKEQFELCRYRLDYKWLLGKGQVIHAGEVPGHTPQHVINVVEIQRRVRLLLNDTTSDISEKSAALARDSLEPLTPLQEQTFCQYLFTCVQIVLQENGTKLADVMPDPSALCLRILSFNTTEQYANLIVSLLAQAHAVLNRQDKSNREAFIDEVKKYIQESDLKNIHLGLVAERFSYSPNYLNHIFKEETGRTILDYIIDCRIEKAKELMLRPGAKLCDVAETLGYSQATYFSMVFKKNVGLTPKKYMERAK
jgi:two-component system response regulator YesN